jgi:hypothetical protein
VSRLPASYVDAKERGVTPFDRERGRIGISFDIAGGGVFRAALTRESVIELTRVLHAHLTRDGLPITWIGAEAELAQVGAVGCGEGVAAGRVVDGARDGAVRAERLVAVDDMKAAVVRLSDEDGLPRRSVTQKKFAAHGFPSVRILARIRSRCRMRAVAIKHAQLRAPTPLPEPEFAAHHAWLEGWWGGIAVGAVVGMRCLRPLAPLLPAVNPMHRAPRSDVRTRAAASTRAT